MKRNKKAVKNVSGIGCLIKFTMFIAMVLIPYFFYNENAIGNEMPTIAAAITFALFIILLVTSRVFRSLMTLCAAGFVATLVVGEVQKIVSNNNDNR
jgi:hypothetical protein